MRLAFAALSLLCVTVNAAPPALRALDEAELTARQTADLRAVDTYRAGLARTIEYARAQTAIFPARRGDKRLLADDEKKQARSVWKTVLDYQLALESIERAHRDFLLLKNQARREGSLLTHYAAHTARYRFALDFIERVENDSELAKILNEPVAELGLARGAYDQFKFHFLNVGEGSQFAALSALYKASAKRATGNTATALTADSERLWEMGRGKGVTMTFANAGNMVRSLGQRAVFPIQAGVSEWMGDTKVRRQHDALISEAQIKTIPARTQPGDVMLQRREWYVSNVGLPGFWSHAALYIGTAEERRVFFEDAEVVAWVKSQGIADGSFETLLRTRHANAHTKALAPQEHGQVPRVLEAISEGVSFTTIEHSAAADSLVALRPKLSKKEKAFAILRAFGYAGRPYDFDFDFQTDTSLVCTELIYKAYEPSANFKGISMKSQEIVGRLAIPANDIAAAFDREFGTAAEQWEMVLFLDGSERKKRAMEADVNAFRTSWQRPKWHIMLPESAAGNAGKQK
jgi:Permuted papain-like amidase enzyme, YaeF/YiiX, C92 family